MMDIYYRAKETSTNNFVYGTPMRDPGGDDRWYMPLIGGDVPIDSSTIGMFTGSTDKNGVNIFDGDIVAIPSSISDIEYKYVILYSNAYQAFMYHLIMGDDNIYTKYGNYFGQIRNNFDLYYNDLHIIGNIFDNPIAPM
jgi:uncharacterized phage protein (TIGR01671 family)